MKLTHRLPIEKWYDYDRFTKLDYPPLEAYLHYIMGMVYKYFEPEVMLDAELYSNDYLTKFQQMEMRILIIAVSYLTYIPAVIFFVNRIFSQYATTLRLYLMMLFFSMPMFVQMEHINTQVNSPSFAFLLLSITYGLEERSCLCAAFGAISIWFKQISIIGVVPIAIYVVTGIYHDAIQKEREKKDKWWICFSMRCFDCILTVLGISALVLFPFWDKPDTIKAMINQLFPYEGREVITTASTIWTALRFLIQPYDNGEYRWIFFRLSSLINIIFCCILTYIMAKKPKNKRLFFCMYVVSTMSSYFFGYHIHEKHIYYVHIGLLMGFTIFHNYLLSFAIISSYTGYFLSYYNYNNLEYTWLLAIHCFVTYFFEEKIRSIVPANEIEMKFSSETKNLKTLYKHQIKYKDSFLRVVLIMIGVLLYAMLKSVSYPNIKKIIMENIKGFSFDIPFAFFIGLYYHFWLCMLIEMKSKDESSVKTLKKD